MKCAAAAGVPVSARGGGHSYASFGLGGSDGALVIDLAKFKTISVDSSGKAAIGAGMRLGDIALALNKKGWALSHGTCPFVGAGGHQSYGGKPHAIKSPEALILFSSADPAPPSLVAGFGLAARQWGLMLDSVVA